MKLDLWKTFGFAAVVGFAMPAMAHPEKGHEESMFKAMDTNSDGKLSPDEHAAGAKKMFEEMDANKDGKVTADEMTAYRDKMGKPPAGKQTMSSADKIKAVDTNGDGVLSAEEHAAGARTMFTKMDTDKDGFLTSAELSAGHQKLMRPPESK